MDGGILSTLLIMLAFWAGAAASKPAATTPLAFSPARSPLLLRAGSSAGARGCAGGGEGSAAPAMGLSVCTARPRRSRAAAEACVLPRAACRRLSSAPAISCAHVKEGLVSAQPRPARAPPGGCTGSHTADTSLQQAQRGAKDSLQVLRLGS